MIISVLVQFIPSKNKDQHEKISKPDRSKTRH